MLLTETLKGYLYLSDSCVLDIYKTSTAQREDFFWWLYEAIEYACKYRGWRDTSKKLNAQQCINKCIDYQAAEVL